MFPRGGARPLIADRALLHPLSRVLPSQAISALRITIPRARPIGLLAGGHSEKGLAFGDRYHCPVPGCRCYPVSSLLSACAPLRVAMLTLFGCHFSWAMRCAHAGLGPRPRGLASRWRRVRVYVRERRAGHLVTALQCVRLILLGTHLIVALPQLRS